MKVDGVVVGDMTKATYDPDADSKLALAQLVAAVCSETEADGKITTHGEGAKHRWTADKLRKGAGAGSNPTEIPPPLYGLLTVARFQENAGTGDFGNPHMLNDNNPATVCYGAVLGRYVEVVFPFPALISQWRQYGTDTNNGDGTFKIQFQGADGAWHDWVTGIAFRTTLDWTSWASAPEAVVATAIKVIYMTTDSGTCAGCIGELEVKY